MEYEQEEQRNWDVQKRFSAFLCFFSYQSKAAEGKCVGNTELTEIRCPKCGKLLGKFDGRGEMSCPRCRSNAPLIRFDTNNVKETRRG